MKHLRNLILVATVLAMVLVACGDSEPEAENLPPVSVTVTDGPNTVGACIEDEPDCVDTVVVGDEPIDLPPDDGGSAGFVVDGGLTVSDALDATGVIAVSGFVVADASGIRLCEALAESMPPQCGGATLLVSDLSTVDPDELKTAQGVTWSDQPVTLIGEIVGDGLVVDPLSL